MSYPSVSFVLSSAEIGLQPISATETTQNHPLGKKVSAADVNYGVGTFMYLKGVASTAAGDLVCFDQKAGTTVRAVHGGTGSNGPCAVAMSANVASQYGWYCIQGSVPVNAATVAANAAAYLTSTAGQVDDAVVGGDLVDGLIIKAADSGGYATCQLSNPSIAGDTAVTSGSQTITGSKALTGVTTLTEALLVDAQPTAGANAATYSGRDLSGWYKVTITKTSWVAAATTQDITIFTLPAKGKLLACYADTTIAYAGLSSTIAIKVSSTAGGGEVLASHDVKSAAVTKGLADADMGTSMTRAASIQGGYLPSWTTTTAISVRLTSGSGNIGDGASTSNLTTGSTDYYFKVELPT